MYLGLGQMSFAIGSTLEGLIAPRLYDMLSSKDTFSREMLLELKLVTPQQLEAIKPGEAFNQLVLLSGRAPEELTQFMYHHHSVASMWYIMAGVGFLTALLILIYSFWWARTGTSAAVVAINERQEEKPTSEALTPASEESPQPLIQEGPLGEAQETAPSKEEDSPQNSG